MWYRKIRRRMILDQHFPEWHPGILSEFNAKSTLDEIERAHVQAVGFFAKCHNGNSYYPTKTGHQHQNLKGRDIFGEYVNESNKRKIIPVAYYSVSWDMHVARTHPEWRMKNSKDVYCMEQNWAYVCLNSPYRDYVKTHIEEIAKGYDIAGFWIDILHFPTNQIACYCDWCKEKFRIKYGRDIPLEPAWDSKWEEFLSFRQDTVEGFMLEVKTLIKGINPRLSIASSSIATPNFHWQTGHLPVKHTTYDDYGEAESYPYIFGFCFHSISPRCMRSVIEGRPYELITSGFNRIHDYTYKTAAQLEWEINTFMANGAAATIVDQPLYNGRVSPVFYDRLEKVFSGVKKKEELGLYDGEPLKEVALYYSARTRDWYGRDNPDKYFLAFNGAFKALIESHIQADVIFDENVTLKKLKKYPLLFLPNVAILTDEEAEIIVSYVKEGGALLATCDTSLYDLHGNQRKDFLLRDLFGTSFKEKTPTQYNYFQIEDPVYGKDIDSRNFILTIGPGNITEKNGIGSVFSTLGDRSEERFFSHGMHPPYEKIGSSLIVNRYGKGNVVYAPFMIDASYASEFMLPEHRFLMRNIIEANIPEAPIKIQAPLNVEVVINYDNKKKRYILHFLSFNPTKQMATTRSFEVTKSKSFEGFIRPGLMIEEPMIYKAELALNGFSKNSIDIYGKDAKINKKDNKIELTIEQIHEIITIKKTHQTGCRRR